METRNNESMMEMCENIEMKDESENIDAALNSDYYQYLSDIKAACSVEKDDFSSMFIYL